MGFIVFAHSFLFYLNYQEKKDIENQLKEKENLIFSFNAIINASCDGIWLICTQNYLKHSSHDWHWVFGIRACVSVLEQEIA